MIHGKYQRNHHDILNLNLGSSTRKQIIEADESIQISSPTTKNSTRTRNVTFVKENQLRSSTCDSLSKSNNSELQREAIDPVPSHSRTNEKPANHRTNYYQPPNSLLESPPSHSAVNSRKQQHRTTPRVDDIYQEENWRIQPTKAKHAGSGSGK